MPRANEKRCFGGASNRILGVTCSSSKKIDAVCLLDDLRAAFAPCKVFNKRVDCGGVPHLVHGMKSIARPVHVFCDPRVGD